MDGGIKKREVKEGHSDFESRVHDESAEIEEQSSSVATLPLIVAGMAHADHADRRRTEGRGEEKQCATACTCGSVGT